VGNLCTPIKVASSQYFNSALLSLPMSPKLSLLISTFDYDLLCISCILMRSTFPACDILNFLFLALSPYGFSVLRVHSNLRKEIAFIINGLQNLTIF
jgi:hypothetical protein